MQLDSRFTQIQFLGEGVSSKVYKAFDQQTQTRVAVKHINPHIANDPIGIERFAANCRSPVRSIIPKRLKYMT